MANRFICAQAFDLEELREVAVKIHQLNSSWNEGKKASYVRHALREYNIHRGLSHARIVALLDIFEIDANTFATVLELCTGGDLDTHLKEHQVCHTAKLHDTSQSFNMKQGMLEKRHAQFRCIPRCQWGGAHQALVVCSCSVWDEAQKIHRTDTNGYVPDKDHGKVYLPMVYWNEGAAREGGAGGHSADCAGPGLPQRGAPSHHPL